MFEITALVVIGLLYVIPLSIPLYNVSYAAAGSLFKSDASQKLAAAFFYVIYAAIIFTILYFVIKQLFFKDTGKNDGAGEQINNFIYKMDQGHSRVNILSNIIILILLFIDLISMVFDIKLIVFGILCIIFVYRHGNAGSRLNGKEKA